jgi:N-ethylmaleimide reductase
MDPSTALLFSPVAAGALRLPNRILMAPMTRSRADDKGHVGALTAQYYAQRAGAGLIISEGIYPEPMGKGYVRTPGLADAQHVAAWRGVTEAVHAAGGRIVAQLMHAGRISDPSLLPGGALPVAPSAVRPQGSTYTDGGMKPHVTPRALALPEIRRIIDSYAAAARRAREAGFDGVELHAGNGYLPMQFLSTKTNRRSDAYGGSAAHRARFVVEALEAIAAEVGAARTGLKITPGKRFNDIDDADWLDTYTTLLQAIRPLQIAFIESAPEADGVQYHAQLRPRFDGAYFAGAGFDQVRAAAALRADVADAFVFGQLFIANPDLPRRFALGAPLAQFDSTTLYAGGARGYVDYPALEPAAA